MAGCSSSSPDEGTVKPGSGVATNPGGKPRTEAEANLANKMTETGNKMNDDRAKAAEAMARARAGGK